jgi:purine-nucleoside phosphorylase
LISAIDLAARSLFERTHLRPTVGIILGSGLGRLASELSSSTEIPYQLIPGWPVPVSEDHAGKLSIGRFAGHTTAVLSGRVHLYEGFSATEVVFGTRVLKAIGVKTLVVTNAAGAVNTEYRPGRLVLIRDHINLQGANPLIGPNDEELGKRFPDMTEAYSTRLRKLAQDSSGGVPEGVYAAVMGPSYETPAEIRYLRTIGADLVGMSTVPEVIAARHMGMEVLGVSVVTNMAAGISGEKLSHEEVLANGEAASADLMDLVGGVVAGLG